MEQREIKYRARWKDTGKVIPDFMDEYTLYHLNDDCILVEEYTGCKDKNGKEIYEGDIVIIGCCKSIKHGEHIGQVGFSSAAFYISIPDVDMRVEHNLGCGMLANIPCHLSRFEVVGNTYENPELLPTPSANENHTEGR